MDASAGGRPTLRQRLEARESLLGTFVKSSDATTAEILAGAGFDFLIADLDHSSLGLPEVEEIARAAAVHGVPVIVRLALEAIAQAGRALDAGATGVQVADCASVAVVESARRQCSYPPLGRRSLALSHRAAGFGRLTAAEYLERSAGDLVLVGQIESRSGVDALPELLAADVGVHAWFLGVLDLSVSLGKPGLSGDPLVVETMHEAARAVVSSGATLGAFAGTAADARRWRELGATMIAVSSDYALLASQADALVRELRT